MFAMHRSNIDMFRMKMGIRMEIKTCFKSSDICLNVTISKFTCMLQKYFAVNETIIEIDSVWVRFYEYHAVVLQCADRADCIYIVCQLYE